MPYRITNMFSFNNVYLSKGINILQIYNLAGDKISFKFIVESPAVCFKEGTLILCLVNNKEKYIPIEQLYDEVYVRTYKHGYKKIKYLIKTKLLNTSKKTINKLYVYYKSEKNKLIEDLYLTGSHSILKNKLSENEKRRMNKLVKQLNIKFDEKIDDKYKLISCFDKNFKEYNEEAYFNIYQIVLENEGDINKIYGIYANGLLVESSKERKNIIC